MPGLEQFLDSRTGLITKSTRHQSWEDRDAIDGWTISLSESFVSTIVGGHPVKILLEDKIAQKNNGTSLALDRLR